ncbi:MAG TPA: hypothetical protein VKU03_15795 [Roseiarcus sp.]|nr:hypothetical protein [Roseiarcus sp.]
MKRLALALAALIAFSASAQAAGYITPAEKRWAPFSAALPACDDPGVLSWITSGFGGKESEYWNSPLQITGYDRIREIGFRSNGVAYIPRRYCIARAALNDSRFHTVIYQIEAEQGFASFGDGVEWCVAGLDRNLAYAPGCSVLRPFVTRYLGDDEKALFERY